MGRCHLCGMGVAGREMVDHLRALHQDEYAEGWKRWPDGEIVTVDRTLEPKDFPA
jgi:hypothetical protein